MNSQPHLFCLHWVTFRAKAFFVHFFICILLHKRFCKIKSHSTPCFVKNFYFYIGCVLCTEILKHVYVGIFAHFPHFQDERNYSIKEGQEEKLVWRCREPRRRPDIMKTSLTRPRAEMAAKYHENRPISLFSLSLERRNQIWQFLAMLRK